MTDKITSKILNSRMLYDGTDDYGGIYDYIIIATVWITLDGGNMFRKQLFHLHHLKVT